MFNCLFKLAQEKSVVRRTDRSAMTIAVDLGHKATKQTKRMKCLAQGNNTVTMSAVSLKLATL